MSLAAGLAASFTTDTGLKHQQPALCQKAAALPVLLLSSCTPLRHCYFMK
uniref:Uncharacterized protein n=1 Tax=Loigolactobacillus rennini TaxID=238013 RepID=A0A1K2IA31_9LACO|nr:hypothetical protein LREN565_2233 [Loigolactobacillus rennini]